MRFLLALAALPGLFASGRLELFHAPAGGEETQITGMFDMYSAPVTDAVSVRFRIRNVGDGPVTLTKLQVAGVGFSSSGAPSLPHVVAAGTNVDFTVRFSPPDYGSYSALLYVNSATYVLKALGYAAIAVLYDGKILTSGDTVDFGRMERGSFLRKNFQYQNTTAEPLGVGRATVSGPAFFFTNGTPLPYLEPGDTMGFSITFRGGPAGVYKERLVVDRREFWLTATVTDPPLPRPTLVVEPGAVRSGEQGRVSIRLSEASRSKAQGTIRMTFEPLGDAKDNDTALQFINGARSFDFHIWEGQTSVYLAGGNTLTFQAGTTAGTIVFTVEAGGFTDRASVTVVPEAVKIDKASAVRGATAVDVRLTGFDNTRTITAMNFTFHSTTGQPLANMPVRVPVAADFNRWWQESRLGGIFGFRASFPVTGDSSQIGGVDVEIVNGSGTTRTERLTF